MALMDPIILTLAELQAVANALGGLKLVLYTLAGDGSETRAILFTSSVVNLPVCRIQPGVQAADMTATFGNKAVQVTDISVSTASSPPIFTFFQTNGEVNSGTFLHVLLNDGRIFSCVVSFNPNLSPQFFQTDWHQWLGPNV